MSELEAKSSIRIKKIGKTVEALDVKREILPNEEFLARKSFKDQLKVEAKKGLPIELQLLLDQTDRPEDRIEILLIEILRALKPKS
jgi:hypothetical protein